MIKSFGGLYSGHVIEGEGLGFDGIPADDRWYPNDRLIQAFDIAKECAQLMDELGYDVFWLAEHHFQREGYECLPNVLMLSLWLSQHTKRIKFGCGFNIIPMWHPLRLAEDFAMVDIFTKGRVIFGVARGYHTREVETFGAPMLDADANQELFEEQVEVVLKAFHEESFSHKGKNYTIPPDVPYRGYQLKEITLVPRPIHRPVEVWQAITSASSRGIDFMAKHGIKGIMAPPPQNIDDWMHQWQEANARHGRQLQLGENLAVSLRTFIYDSREDAKRALLPMFEERQKLAAPLGMLRYTDEQMKAVGPSGVETPNASGVDFDKLLETKAWLGGPSKDIIDYLKELEERFPGLEQVVLPFPTGFTREQMKEQLTRFAEEVMPAFRKTKVA